VAVYLPKAAFDVRTLDLSFSEAGLDPPLWMVGKRIYIEEGATKSVAIEFKLPATQPGVLLLPSGRVRPMEVTVNGVTTNDAIPRALGFRPRATEDDLAAAPVIAALLALAGVLALLAATRRLRPTAARPLVAPSLMELRLPSLGLILLVASGATLVLFAVVDSLRPR
jgi:hypothetical protein